MNKQKYLELVEKRRREKAKDKDKVIELEMPSGAVWKVLPLSVGQYAASGKLPLHLLVDLPGAKTGEVDERELAERMTGKDIANMLSIARDAMLNNVIEPRITLEETEESITPEMLDPEDFEYFTQYVLSGGQTLPAARSFRPEPRKKAAGKRK